ncbi:hypothetical protein QJS04_geneDACA002230 [Acorus gramineus]|uniref:Uncharacterized protein n=1 Tax=Acorus gramineus TaxID=55184 RepID=A0AAV9A8S8_ACOGR|nr:hypothetical protein QJS04_geneDACA002230 [Acorus gramineus]
MAASIHIAVGSHVWVEDPDVSWIDGEVVEATGKEVKVICTSGKTVVANVSNIYPKDAEALPCGVDDMTKLAYLHEPGVLQNLRSRYDMNEIYLVLTIGVISFTITLQSNPVLEAFDDSKEYIATRRAMDVVGISPEEQDAIFRVVAAILHLGNIEFSKGKEVDSSQPKDEKSFCHLRTAAELFMCDAKALEDSLCKRVIVTRDETITKSLDPDSATLCRDALAKIVYSRLFDWLVNKINSSIGQDPESKFLIGVLDIYGFESFKTNSFEQFCINLTNEKLQQHFNQHVFKMEQEEYTKEEIDWSYIEFIDNQDILDLIEKKPGGIIALLDEACMFPRSTHETFAQKLYQTYKNHKRFSKPKLARTDFTICHYAGDVTYQTELFLDKNKDYVIAEHQALLNASTCCFVSGLFPPLAEDSSKSSKFSSIGSRFKGVMEAIRISCAGYPSRRTFDEFIDRFGLLAPGVLDGSCDEVTASKMLLEKAGLDGYQYSHERYGHLVRQIYESLRREAACLKIQKNLRMCVARKTYKELLASSITIQSGLRGMAARKELLLKRQTRAAITIQAAKETGALQAAKNKLEKQVEELTWRLQLEKRMRADLEEAKTQENAKLQSALQEMQLQFKEAKAALMKEREVAKRAAEEAPIIREVPVIDTTLLNKLTVENEKLKALVSSLENKIDETEKKYEDTNKLSEERLKQAMEAESKIIQLKTSMQRLEEKLSNMESEDQILRQQALPHSPIKRMSEHLAIPTHKTLENGHHEVTQPKEDPQSTPKKDYADSDHKLRRYLVERQHNQDDNEHLSYWLSNTSALLFLLQRSLKAAGGAGATPRRKPPPSTSFFGRMAQGFRSSPSSADLVVDGLEITVHQVEPKYPALLFKQQVTAYVEKIYGIIRDNLKKDLTALLAQCIQYAGSSWDELKHIRQAVGFLVIFQKSRISYDEIVNDLCPILSVQQLFRICTNYWDDKYNTKSVSQEVLTSMTMLMTEDSNNATSSAYLLEDNSSIPFSVDDISSSLHEKDFSDVRPAEELLKNPAFQFLQE